MASGAIITGTWARCKNHFGKLLEPDEDMCWECRIIQRNLSLVPPFAVFCIDDAYNIVKKGKTYEVAWVVLDGREAHNLSIKGYVFKMTDGSMTNEVIDAAKFIPVQYLTKKGKDAWLEPDE